MLKDLSGESRRPDVMPVFQSRRKLVAMLDRLDPFYEVEWIDALSTKWEGISVNRLAYSIDSYGTVSQNSDPVFAPIKTNASRLYTPLGIKSMAALAQFHQLTTYQLATLFEAHPNDIKRALTDLFAFGVIERAEPLWGDRDFQGRKDSGSGHLWRLSNHVPQLEEWMMQLEPLEAKLVAQGRDIAVGTNSSRGGSALRHNLAASELLIRAQESCPAVIGAWGEWATQGELFLNEEVRKRADLRKNIGDGAIVLKNGSIIVLETSGASNLDDKGGDKLEQKAAAWAAIAALTHLDLKIVFVNINSKAKMNRFEWRVMKGLSQIGRQISNVDLQKKGVEAVFIANAYDWFPMPMTASVGFANLQSFHPIAKRYYDLAPAVTSFDVNSDAMVNTVAALHTPKWVLRRVTNITTSVINQDSL